MPLGCKRSEDLVISKCRRFFQKSANNGMQIKWSANNGIPLFCQVFIITACRIIFNRSSLTAYLTVPCRCQHGTLRTRWQIRMHYCILVQSFLWFWSVTLMVASMIVLTKITAHEIPFHNDFSILSKPSWTQFKIRGKTIPK